jgi:hypothetical protein
MPAKFTQTPLDTAPRGIADFVAFLEGNAASFAEGLNITFTRDRDDLDYMDIAHICTTSGVHAFLVCYPRAPKEGVNVVINERAIDPKHELAEVLEALGEVGKRIIWKRDDL